MATSKLSRGTRYLIGEFGIDALSAVIFDVELCVVTETAIAWVEEDFVWILRIGAHVIESVNVDGVKVIASIK